MKAFDELLRISEACMKSCPWTKKQSIDSYAKELQDEVMETRKAVENKEWNNLNEELGDVIWDALMVIRIAEAKWLFTADEVLKEVTEEIKRRKPYILDGKSVTTKEAMKIWQEIKRKEKNG